MRRLYSTMLLMMLMFSLIPISFAWEIERPSNNVTFEAETVANATTNGEATVGLGVHVQSYEENHPNFNDGMWLRIATTANTRKGITYGWGNVSYIWVDIDLPGLGQVLMSPEHPYFYVPISVGPNVRFYGGPRSAEFTSLYVSKNGVLYFDNRLNKTGDPPEPSSYYDKEIPNTDGLNAFVAPFWRELNPHLGGRVLYANINIIPPGQYGSNRQCTVISWIDVPDKFGNPQTFQVIVELSRPLEFAYAQNRVWFQYKNVTFDQNATVGIEDHGGWDGFSIDPQIPQVIQGNKAIIIGQVAGYNSFLVSTLTIKLTSYDSASTPRIDQTPDWIKGYNVELNDTLPDDTLKYALAFGDAFALGIDAFAIYEGGVVGAVIGGVGFLLGCGLALIELNEMVARAQAEAKLFRLERQEAVAHADGEVVDASLDVLVYWEFLDWATNDQNHWLNVTAELSYVEVSVDGVYADTNTTSTSVILKTVPDAGNTIDAPSVREISHGSYKAFVGVNIPSPGFNDCDDYYKIYVDAGMVLHLTMTPPNNTNFDFYLYDPGGRLNKSSTMGTGVTENIHCATNASGYWFIRVNAVTGYGIYTLTIDQPYPAPWITILTKTTTGAEITNASVMVDLGKWYGSPVIMPVLPGGYYIGVYQSFVRGHYNYTFQNWSDGSTSYARYLNINNNISLTAYFVEQFFNNPPNTPSKPSGTANGYVFVNYNNYYTNTTDPDGDNIRYEFNWGDGTNNTTTNWYTSGVGTYVPHTWTRPGTYSVSARAQDNYTAFSYWSTSLTVSISQNDAGQGYDAGNSFSSATYVGNYAYTGTLYQSNPTDTEDWYQFSAPQDQIIGVAMTPPYNANFDLQLYDPNGNLKAGSYLGTGYMDSVYYTADTSGMWRIKIYRTSGEGQYSFSVTISGGGGGGGCPILYVYNNGEYVCEGLLDIHNLEGTDIITNHTLAAMPQRFQGTYIFRLIEHPYTHSYIDQVKLYAVLQNGMTIQLPLIWAWHSENGNALPELFLSDDYRTDTLGAVHNNGVSQSINLRFLALPPYFEVVSFIFQIEGHNWEFKP